MFSSVVEQPIPKYTYHIYTDGKHVYVHLMNQKNLLSAHQIDVHGILISQ